MSKMLDDYVPVNERVKAFYEAYPDGAIMTDLIDVGESVRVRAVAYRFLKSDSHQVLSSGHSEEMRGAKTDKILEKQESVAVGRALALGGFLASASLASREEMESFTASKAEPVREHAVLDTLPDAEVARIEPLVKEWLGKDKARREKFKLKLVTLGVTDTQGSLKSVIGQIPTIEKAGELLTWLGQDVVLTGDEVADALVADGTAAEIKF
jgi:hypothetical protein